MLVGLFLFFSVYQIEPYDFYASVRDVSPPGVFHPFYQHALEDSDCSIYQHALELDGELGMDRAMVDRLRKQLQELPLTWWPLNTFPKNKPWTSKGQKKGGALTFRGLKRGGLLLSMQPRSLEGRWTTGS
ncbi:hypothetical protein LIER_19107 [Lithospermum erythrorhizon]|uniref:Uncharacterized protein n=1 Tax=Lithospermum erythrorhizon TaxID=34254 RepID=A0AAV3QJM2_LITER